MTLSLALRIVAGLIAIAAASGSLSAFFRQRDRARLDAALLMAAMAVTLFTLDRVTRARPQYARSSGSRVRPHKPELPRDEYPDFADHVDQHMTKSVRTNGKSEFEFGLDLILDGLEQMPHAASRAAATKRTRAKRAVRRVRSRL